MSSDFIAFLYREYLERIQNLFLLYFKFRGKISNYIFTTQYNFLDFKMKKLKNLYCINLKSGVLALEYFHL